MICDMTELMREIVSDEGRSHRRFLGANGRWIIGIGHNLHGQQLPRVIWRAIETANPHVSNALLDDHVTLSDELVDRIFANDVTDAMAALYRVWPQWDRLSEPRKRAIVNLSFQVDIETLRRLKGFWAAMRDHDFARAAEYLRDSLWFRQARPNRASRVIRQIREGG